MKIALGGRFGFVPVENIEIGASYASFLNENNKADMSLAGVDLQCSYNAISVKGEYIQHATGSAGDNKLANTGYYVQGMYDFGKYFMLGRYGAFTPDGGEEISRISAGVGYVVLEGLEFRVEYQANGDENNQTFFQMVGGL